MDPNVWAVLSGVAAMMALSHTMLLRTLRSEIHRLDTKVDGLDGRLNQRIDGLEIRLNDKIDSVELRLTERIDSVELHLTDKIDGVELHLTDKIDGVDERHADKADNLARIVDVQFGSVDKRLSALEQDMSLVKAHLLGVSRAG